MHAACSSSGHHAARTESQQQVNIHGTFLCHNFCTFEYIMDSLRFKKINKLDKIEKNSPNHLKSPKIENLRGA
jgi:hypothetical protein